MLCEGYIYHSISTELIDGGEKQNKYVKDMFRAYDLSAPMTSVEIDKNNIYVHLNKADAFYKPNVSFGEVQIKSGYILIIGFEFSANDLEELINSHEPLMFHPARVYLCNVLEDSDDLDIIDVKGLPERKLRRQ